MLKYIIPIVFVMIHALCFAQRGDKAFAPREDKVFAREVDRRLDISAELLNTDKPHEAKRVAEDAMDLATRRLGTMNEHYARCLNLLGRCHTQLGQFKEAVDLITESKDVREKLFGKEHRAYIASLSNLAVVYFKMCQYEEAEKLQLQERVLIEKMRGKEHIEYAQCLFDLSNLYFELFDFEEAELLLLECKEIMEKKPGENPRLHAGCLTNLGVLYSRIGSNQTAEGYYLEVLGIHADSSMTRNEYVVKSMNGLASLYRKMGRFDLEDSLRLEAKAIWEKQWGKNHPGYANVLRQLGGMYLRWKDYVKAEALYIEAKTINETYHGIESIEYARSMQCLAYLNLKKRDVKKAESLYLEIKALWDKNGYSKESKTYGDCLDNLAMLYEAQNRFDESERLIDTAFQLTQMRLRNAVSFLSARELADYVTTFQEEGSQLSSTLHARLSDDIDPGILPALIYNWVLLEKGFLMSAASHLNTMASATPEEKALFDQLNAYRRRLAKEYAEPELDRKSIEVLEENANLIEKELARTSLGLNEIMQQVHWEEVQETLTPGEAAVEFIQYNDIRRRTSDSVFYSALVLLHGEKMPMFVPLFEEQQIASLIHGANSNNFKKINALYSGGAKGHEEKTIYDLVWKPIEAQLQGIKTVYCSPSGLLHRINLGAISIDAELTFTDRHQLVLMNSTRQLVTARSYSNSGNDGYIVGGVQYEIDSSAIDAFNTYSVVRRRTVSDALSVHLFQTDSTSRGSIWNYLPQTVSEALEINDVFQSSNFSTQLDTGYLATEEEFRNLGTHKPSPRIMHIATHGFFFPDPQESVDARQLEMEREPVFKISEHPMMRSGLIMATAQYAWSTGNTLENREDGILTAYEISQMNLSSTELVVLSACETGLGQIEGNEGVYGLQRAFKIAGAKYLIMSLWKVNDQSTRELMTEFYEQWLINALPIRDAFRTAQNTMQMKYPNAPYHWAGFVLVE